MTRLLNSMRVAETGTPPATAGFWHRWTQGVRKIWQRSDWENFAGSDWPATILDTEVTDDFHAKQGRSTGRWVLHRGDRKLSVYLKRHYRLGWWQGLLAALFPKRDWSPAFQEMRHLRWAAARGLAAPKVVAAAEFIGPRGKLQSVLAIEELA
ncbi:MAG: hypothetical protein HY040_27045, partial [Planctomycetes bacterium]|nr:hypothetical protein [Planctomycetota bacterium]